MLVIYLNIDRSSRASNLFFYYGYNSKYVFLGKIHATDLLNKNNECIISIH